MFNTLISSELVKPSKHGTHRVALFFAPILAVATLTGAASAQGVPTSVEPGQIEKNLSSPMKQNMPGVAPKLPAAPKPAVVAPDGAKDMTFVLKELTVEGSSVYSKGELLEAVKGKVGQEISVAELFDIAATLTARYRNDGYMLSTVVVPPQKIGSGKVVLKAVEGYLDRIVVEGVTSNQKTTILSYLNKVIEQRPLKSKNLERYLLLVDDLSGLSLKTFVEPSLKNGGAATLTVKPKIDRFNAWSTADNRGSDFVGPYNLALGGTLHSPVALGQSFSGQILSTPTQNKELRYVSLSSARELDTEGTSVAISVAGMKSQPGKELRELELKSRSLSVDVSLRAKPYRSRDANLFVSLVASARQADTKALDALLSQDRSRQVRFGLDFQSIDALFGANSVSAGASQGITGLGATPSGSVLLSRSDADTGATWFDVSIARVQSLGMFMPGVDLRASVSGQYALKPLSASREFSVGGKANASAFDSSEITGDHGVSGRLELRYATDLGVVDRAVPEAWQGFAMQIYAFGDGGRVWQERVGQAENNGQVNDAIASAGVGARWNLGPYTSATVEVAKPFMNNVTSEGDKDPRAFFNLTNRF
jgi:hemolysin activation/secretion protein